MLPNGSTIPPKKNVTEPTARSAVSRSLEIRPRGRYETRPYTRQTRTCKLYDRLTAHRSREFTRRRSTASSTGARAEHASSASSTQLRGTPLGISATRELINVRRLLTGHRMHAVHAKRVYVGSVARRDRAGDLGFPAKGAQVKSSLTLTRE